MKKIGSVFSLISVFLISLNVYAKSKYDPECSVSGFDNVETCIVKPYGVYVFDKNTMLSTVSFGGLWVNSIPDHVSLTITLGDVMANVDKVSFNIDGEINTFPVDIRQNKITRSGNLGTTISAVIIPVDYLEKLLSGKDVKYRVSTISNGYREGSFYSEKGQASEPIKTLQGLLDIVKK
jgi:hypothetical protein